MNEDFILRSINGYYIVESDMPDDSEIEMPDTAKTLGCSSGKVVQSPARALPTNEEKAVDEDDVGRIIFYDGSKAFKLHTSDGDYIAINEKNIIAFLK